MITLENIDQLILDEINKMREAANTGDSKKVELIGNRVKILSANALLLARRRSHESEVLFRRNIGSPGL